MKFGGGATQHHNHSMSKHFLFVGITSCLIRGAHLLVLDVEHDHPFRTITNTIGYFVFWP